VFFGKESGKPVLDPAAVEAVAELVELKGSDAWFEEDPAAILPHGYVHPETGEKEFTKETDVLDVWFDSGSTSLCVLEGNVESEWKEKWPADLYLEGSDQHRGWFNSSLVLGTAIKGKAPYRQLVTHGMVLDQEGTKISKRLANFVDPVEICGRYGADVLRFWVASVEYQNDVPCSEELLKQMGEQYRSVRNSLRFLLGNLYDYDASAPFEWLDLDRWICRKADLLVRNCLDSYEAYDFGEVISGIHNFCVNELSRFYLDAIKDRMYCDGKDWPSRRSGQAACHYVLVRLTTLLAPILPHTAEEVWDRIPFTDAERGETVHAALIPVPTADEAEAALGTEFDARFEEILALRSRVFAEFEPWKAASEIKDSQDVAASIHEQGAALDLLRSFSTEELSNYLKMSWITLEEGPFEVAFHKSEYLKCERSRLRRPDVEEVDGVPLTARDRKVLGL